MFDWKQLFNYLLEFRAKLLWGQGVTLLAILLSLPIPLLLPVMVDEVLLKKGGPIVNTIDNFFGSGSAFYYIFIVFLTVVLLRFFYLAVTVLQIKIFTALSKHVTYRIREKMLKHLESVSMNAYESLGSGAVSANLITDVNTLDTFIVNGASKMVASIFTLLGVAIVIVLIHPLLGLMILVFQPLVMLLTKSIAKNVGRLKKEENQSIETFQQDVGESLELFGQIKASNKEHFFFNRLRTEAKAIQDTSNRFGYKSVAAERLSFTVFLSAFELFRAAGLLMVVYSDLSIGMMFAMFGYIWFIMTPVQDLLSMQYSFASAKAALERINKVMQLPKEAGGTQTLKKSAEGVTVDLKNVSFAYKADEPILEGVTMHLPARSKVAIIGSSGSGKTTLAQIIAGFYPKSSGELFYNSQSIEKLDRASIRQSVFLVLQMPILFNDTLRFNVTMGSVHSDAEILKALEMAQMKEAVDTMSDGLDTVVGRHGVRLSGGQRQRMAMARMILADPDIVIFDESTSALDVHTEAHLFEALNRFLADKTVITIAHRLSTVIQAEKIFVLESGHIVQEGTHEALAAQEGHYFEFIKRQST